MARAKKNGAADSGAGVGDNSQAEAELLVHHMSKLRAKKVLVDEAKAALSAEQDEMTELFRIAKVDGFTRKELTSYLADTLSRLRNLLDEEKRRFRHRQALGLPVFGEQQAFNFGGDETPLETKDELFWEAEGYLNGRRGASAALPEDLPPRFNAAWLRGDARGQAENGELLKAGAKRAAATPDAEAAPVELASDQAASLDPDEIAAKARKLKRSGWVEPAAADAKLEPVH